MALETVKAGSTAGPAGVTAVKTRAEAALASEFNRVIGELPGSGWVARLRQSAIDDFVLAGLPSRRDESFKYTDLRQRLRDGWRLQAGAPTGVDRAAIDRALGPLADLDAHRIVFVDGAYCAEVSDLGQLGGSAEAMSLAPLLRKAPAWLEGKFTADRLVLERGVAPDATTLINTAFMTDGLMLKIKPGETHPKPVLLVMARGATADRSTTASAGGARPAHPMTALRHVIAMEAGSRATLIEAHVALDGASPGLANVVVDVTLAAGAALEHIACFEPGTEATQLSTVVAKLAADADYRLVQMTSRVALARNQIAVTLGGTGGTLDVACALLGRARQHIDTTLVVDHAAPDCQSRELVKAVLDDRARVVFQGKIIVRKGSDRTDGKQLAKALMLSEDAEFDSKPELEIFADDVACGHGATCAELDPELVFYCCSRGIPEAEARALLVEAFIVEAIDKVGSEAVRTALLAVARRWLARSHLDQAAPDEARTREEAASAAAAT